MSGCGGGFSDPQVHTGLAWDFPSALWNVQMKPRILWFGGKDGCDGCLLS